MSTIKSHVMNLVAVTALLTLGSTAWAGLVTTNPELPPDGEYLSPDDVHNTYTGADLEVVLSAAIHKPVADGAVREDVGGDELETFDSTLTGMISTTIFDLPGVGELVLAAQPVILTGQVQVLTTGKTGNTTGTFDTEIVSMSLTGIVLTPELAAIGGPPSVPVTINESPSLSSLGQTTILDIGGGLYQIDSFFDVFTELVVPDITAPGEFITIPSAGSAHMELVPEPSTFTLAALALLGLCCRRRKRLRSRLYLLDTTQQVCVMKTSVLMLCSLAIMVISTRNAIAAQSDFSESNGLTGIVDFDTGNVNFGTAACTVANGCITSYSFSDGAVSETWSHTSPIIDTPLSLNMSGSTIIGTNTDWVQSPDTGTSRVLSQPAGLNGTLSSQHADPGGLVLGAGDGTFSAVVPEPGSLTLLGVGTVVLLGRSRSRKGLS